MKILIRYGSTIHRAATFCVVIRYKKYCLVLATAIVIRRWNTVPNDESIIIIIIIIIIVVVGWWWW